MKWVITGIIVLATAARVAMASEAQPIKDEDGKTYAVIVTCSDCQSDSGKKACHEGVEEGWAAGQGCGKCLIAENSGARFAYPYDVHITGTLTDPEGKPLKDRFVKLFMANGWNVRTRTGDDGSFRMILGATADRKGETPLTISIGKRIDSKTNEANYALFLVPEGYKQCPAAAAPASGGAKKSSKKKK